MYPSDENSDKRSIIAIFGEAIATADRIEDEARLLGAHFEIAQLLQKLGLDSAFGDTAAKAIRAMEEWRARHHPLSEEWRLRNEGRRVGEEKAKQLFFAGDLAGAETAYLAVEELRPDHERQSLLGAHLRFFEWQLATGDLASTLAFFNSNSLGWGHPWTRSWVARKLSLAFIKAGDRASGLDVLRSLQREPNPGVIYSAESLWLAGEPEEARLALRRAAHAAHEAATGDLSLSLSDLLSIAGHQCIMSDPDGANETLDGVMQLAVPLEYDPPPRRPARLKPSDIWIAAPRLKPAAKRGLENRLPLVFVLARAGRDVEALSFLSAPQTKQPEVLNEVVRGQAARGAFALAFATWERLSSEPLMVPAEPSHITLKPSGEVSVYRQSAPTRFVEPLERRAAAYKGLANIALAAAYYGDVEIFKRVDSLRPQVAATGAFLARDFPNLKRLAKAGQIDTALEFARLVADLYGRVQALLAIIKGIAGVPDQFEGEFTLI